jgi:hypothetical protein
LADGTIVVEAKVKVFNQFCLDLRNSAMHCCHVIVKPLKELILFSLVDNRAGFLCRLLPTGTLVLTRVQIGPGGYGYVRNSFLLLFFYLLTLIPNLNNVILNLLKLRKVRVQVLV